MSDHLPPGFRWNVQVSPSGECDQLVAQSPSSVGPGPYCTSCGLLHHEGVVRLARAARAYAFEVFGDVQATVDRGDELSAEQRHRARQVTTYATRVAADVVRCAYTWAGSDGLRPGALQRCFRDMHAATQHIFVDNSTLTAATAVLLDGYSAAAEPGS